MVLRGPHIVPMYEIHTEWVLVPRDKINEHPKDVT